MESVYRYQPGFRTLFDAILTSEDFEQSKPHPDCYLRAAQRLGAQINECIVFEDSPNGVRAGHDAGCQVIMVPDTVPATEELRELSTVVCGSLLEALELLVTIQGFD